MKAVYYTRSLFEDDFSATDAIVYSQLLYRSLWDDKDSSFTNTGEFTTYEYTYYTDSYVPLTLYSAYSDVAPAVNVSTAQFYRAKKKLEQGGYIANYEGKRCVWMIPNITSSFFPLRTDTNLSGSELIVYSYLDHKCETYGWVDKYHYAIADELNIPQSTLHHILTSLYYKGFIWRRRRRNRHCAQTELKTANGKVKPVRKGEVEYWR